MNTICVQKTLSGSEIISEILCELGLTTVFGYPGGIVLDMYDELYRCRSKISHILVRHEQAAVHAAEGYARVSGKCGVVLVTSGPGATNTVTGIANAYLDGYPLIVITGQVSASLIGKNSFQEVNILDITKSCTKAGFQVTSAKELQNTFYKAYDTAMSGRKGPVVIDISKNVFKETCEYSEDKRTFNSKSYTNFDVEPLVNLLANSSSPLVVSGGGVVQAGCEKQLYAFVKELNVPIVSTMMGLGAYPRDEKNYLGMIGLFGDDEANNAIKSADIILSFGARFNDRITSCFKPEDIAGKIIQIDINQEEIGRNYAPVCSLVGDAGEILDKILESIKGRQFNFTKFSERTKGTDEEGEDFTSSGVINCIYEQTCDKNYYITSEVGQHQISLAKHYKFNFGGQLIASCGSGTMGFGLPAAIGACIASKQPVLCVAGDGSFQMNEQELATIVKYKLPVKIFIINNGYLGMVRQLQEKLCEGRYYETQIDNPDFIKLAESYGIVAESADDYAGAKRSIQNALACESAYIVDFRVNPIELV